MNSTNIHITRMHLSPQPAPILLRIIIVTIQMGLVALGLITLATLTSCHTAAGLGRDVERAGQAIENSATNHHHN